MMNEQPAPLSNTTSSSSASTTDIEADLEKGETEVPIEGGGYDELANFMAIHSGAAIVPHFKKWYIKKLLYHQSELTGLGRELMRWDQEDRSSADSHRQLYHRDYWEFCHCKADSQAEDGNDKQWKTWNRMEIVLKEYAQTLQHVKIINDMHEVDKYNLKFLQKWMSKDGNVVLTGEGWDHWKSGAEDSLMALDGRVYDDQLTRYVEKKLVPWYNHLFGRWHKKPIPDDSPLAGTFSYEVHQIGRIISIIIVGLATALPICAIAVLSLPQSNSARLGLMALFTVLFSLCLGFLSGAKKTEIFAASAAFAAVQVVFVSGSPSCPTA